MKQILSLMIFTLAFCYSALAQTNNLQCPQISVTGPASANKPLETIVFTANVINGDKYKITYKWAIDSGEIIEGQGTRTISVKPGIEAVTATVEIEGIPEGCESEASGTSIIFCPRPVRLIDEYPFTAAKINIESLNTLAEEIRADPNLTVLITIYSKNSPSSKAVKGFISQAYKYLTQNHQIAKEIIYFSVEKDDGEMIRHIIIPQGAEFPPCEDCKIIKGKDLQ